MQSPTPHKENIMKQKTKSELYGTMRRQYKQIQELKADNVRLLNIITLKVADAGLKWGEK